MIKSGQFTHAMKKLLNPIVRVYVYRIDKLELNSFQQTVPAVLTLECKLATEHDMKLLFENWQDSQEECQRHHEVYYNYGFKKCFLFINKENDEITHLQFLITYDDMPTIKKVLPIKLYKYLTDASCASQEWIYTFNKYRKKGIAIQAMSGIVNYCKINNISTLYSHRGMKNLPSIHMANKIGYIPVAKAIQVQILNQKRHHGIYVITGENT